MRRSTRRYVCLIALAISGIVAAGSAASADVTTVADPPLEKRSGLAFQSSHVRAMQANPTSNPAMLWVAQGAQMWEAASDEAPACAGCHGDAASSMRGVAARYPAIDEARDVLENLELRINRCRMERQGLPALPYESDELLALTAFVAHQSQGLPVNVAVDGPAAPFFERGRAFYQGRQGQLNLACSHCHDNHWGRRLRGETLSQGHGNGYPIYRLQWQTVGSLHRRFKVCSAGVRARMYDYGSPEYLALELYLAWRAAPLAIETPAVRR